MKKDSSSKQGKTRKFNNQLHKKAKKVIIIEKKQPIKKDRNRKKIGKIEEYRKVRFAGLKQMKEVKNRQNERRRERFVA
jgi:hypothetical protein